MSIKKYQAIAVLMGGLSSERQVSLVTGRAVQSALERRGYAVTAIDLQKRYYGERLAHLEADAVFIALHGGVGESGEVQTVLEAFGIPYTGSGPSACALTLDKARTKGLLQSAGIPTAPFRVVKIGDFLDTQAIVQALGLPLFVKPVREGSSVGIVKVHQADKLAPAVAYARRYDSNVLLEACLPGSEYTVAWLKGQALPTISIKPHGEFYDYDAKYLTGTTEYFVPVDWSLMQEQVARSLAEQVAQIVDLQGWGRVDFIADAQGTLCVVEVNTVPGLTESSLVPKAAQAAGMSFDDLIETIVSEASLKTRWSADREQA